VVLTLIEEEIEKNEDKKPVEKVEPSIVVPKIPVRVGYIPGAELQEEKPSLPSAKSNTQVPLSPTKIDSNTLNKPESSTTEIPEPEILPVEQEILHVEKDITISKQDLPSESIPTEDNDSLFPLPNTDIIQKNNSKPSLRLNSISQNNNKEGTVIESHENGLKDSNQISQTFTFNLSSPLGHEITTGEQTLVEMNGSLYLKISPNTMPLPAWYISLQEDFENSRNPSKTLASQKGKNVKKKPF